MTNETNRDLAADLAICDVATEGPIRITPCTCGRCNQVFISLTHSDGRFDPEDATFIIEARTGWPIAIKRAIDAESRLEAAEAENSAIMNAMKTLRLAYDSGVEGDGLAAAVAEFFDRVFVYEDYACPRCGVAVCLDGDNWCPECLSARFPEVTE